MKTQNDGGPAFPRARALHKRLDLSRDSGYHESEAQDGMSLRDWFAGMALSGLVENFPQAVSVRMAYETADAMLAERNK